MITRIFEQGFYVIIVMMLSFPFGFIVEWICSPILNYHQSYLLALCLGLASLILGVIKEYRL